MPPRRVHLRDLGELGQVLRLLALGALVHHQQVGARGEEAVVERELELLRLARGFDPPRRRDPRERAVLDHRRRQRRAGGERLRVARARSASAPRRPTARPRTPRRRGSSRRRRARPAAAWSRRRVAGQAISARSTRGARSRANMRRIAPSASSFGATNSQAPPLASARRFSTPSAGALPMPTTNTRCFAARASATRPSASQISPSVISSTSAASSLPPSANTLTQRRGHLGAAEIGVHRAEALRGPAHRGLVRRAPAPWSRARPCCRSARTRTGRPA